MTQIYTTRKCLTEILCNNNSNIERHSYSFKAWVTNCSNEMFLILGYNLLFLPYFLSQEKCQHLGWWVKKQEFWTEKQQLFLTFPAVFWIKKNFENWESWKSQFFWVGHLEFFCFIPIKISLHLQCSKDGSKFRWLPWFIAKE